MTDVAIQKALLTVTKLKPRTGESAEDFTRRVWQKCQGLNDEGWQSLGEPAQAWVNDYTVKNENKATLPVLTLPEAESAKPAKAEPEAERVSEQESTVAKKESNGAKTAKPAKEPKAKKVAKAPKESKAAAGKRGRPHSGPPNEGKIVVVEKKPPGREGTRRQKVYALYKPGMTVKEAHEAGVPYNFMRWHIDQGWIEVRA